MQMQNAFLVILAVSITASISLNIRPFCLERFNIKRFQHLNQLMHLMHISHFSHGLESNILNKV